jgi:cell division septum initiation protein DivIVA
VSVYEQSTFRRALRGYDTEDVDTRVGELERRLTETTRENLEMSDRLYEAERELQKSLRDLANANEKVAARRSSLSDIGGEFESTLRLAEEQGRQIREDAHAEATETLRTAREDSIRIRDAAMRDAQSLLVESQRRAETIQSDLETARARAEMESAELITQARLQVSSAERAATAQMLDAEKRASTIITDATRQARDIKKRGEEAAQAQMAVIDEAQAKVREQEIEIIARQKAMEEWLLEAQDNQRDKDVEAEARRDRLDQESRAAIERAQAEADERITAAMERATQMAADADERLARAHAESMRMLTNSQQSADQVIASATARAHRLAERTDQLSVTMLREAEMQLAEARHRKTLLNRYVDDVREILVSDGADGLSARVALDSLAIEQVEQVD